jgi:hypothetical protein
MFKASIDNKKKVTDPNGNEIVDLTSSTFRNNNKITQYMLRKVPTDYKMRPDLIALTELGSTDKTEYIMMFNQIGNPFSIDKDDVLLIPELIEADSLVYSDIGSSDSDTDNDIRDILVKNYYKHSNRDTGVDMSSYDDFLNTSIPSGNPTRQSRTRPQGESVEPYMLNDNEESIVIRNGRIYFNDENDIALQETNDNSIGSRGWNGLGYNTSPSVNGINGGISVKEIDSTNADAKIISVLNGVNTDLSEANCTYNGTNLADFIKSRNLL